MEKVLFDRFLNYGKKIEVQRGEMIYNALCDEGEKTAYFLMSGVVAMTNNTLEGDERIYLYIGSQRLIGFAPFLIHAIGPSFFENRSRRVGHCQISLVAKTRCELYQLSGAVCQKLLDSDMEFNRLVIQALTVNYLDLLEHFQQELEESAGIRFCRLLLEAYLEIDGKMVIPKNITFVEMSKYLGTHPVTVSRIFALLKKDGCIDKEQGGVVIKNKEKLVEIIKQGEDLKI